jgi:hypothetical protein
MFYSDYLVEILTPKRMDGVNSVEQIQLFAERYYRVFDSLPYKPGASHPVASAPFEALKEEKRGQIFILDNSIYLSCRI